MCVSGTADPASAFASYRALAARLRPMAADAPLAFCGMSACVDATIAMHDMQPLLDAVEPPEAVALATMLKDRAARGIGGEVRVEWPGGAAWLAERLGPRYALGGTGPHAGWVLATLGAPALLNLADRSRHMLSLLPAGLLLADKDDLLAASAIAPSGARRPNVFIFEYAAGVPVGDVVPPRSTRIIVRFDDLGLEHDDAFDAVTLRLAGSAGCGLVAGFSAVSAGELGAEIERVFDLTRRWRAAGLSTIHLEMSGHETAAGRDRVLDAVAGSGVTSIGMSHSEFVEIRPRAIDDARLAPEMLSLAGSLGVRRVCVHADHWAAAATLDDAATEHRALMAGCLLASARAVAGRPVVPGGADPQARFGAAPFGPIERHGAWRLVAVPSPYLARPMTTLGLGDTFTAGCLLVLGTADRAVTARKTAGESMNAADKNRRQTSTGEKPATWRRKSMKTLLLGLMAALLAGSAATAETTLTVATVNNNDMVVMQRLSKDFEQKNPDIKLNWVVLEENTLRQRLTTDISTNGGQYDVMTIGLYEAPMWGERGWLSAFDAVPADYKLDDVLQSVREGLSAKGKLYALPFYAESQMTFYRKDLLDKAGVTMPDQPTWKDIDAIGAKIHDPANGVYGVCLRGKPGWGENMGQVTPVANSYGARWFDEKWKAQLDTPEWKEGLTTYVDLLKKYGPPGASSNGYNETLALFAGGKCGIWVDATVSAGFLSDKDQSTVIGKVGYAHPPYGKFNKGNHYLWTWALGVPVSSKSQDAAKKFIYWATSQDYIKSVAADTGWATVPPGTRRSTYDNPEYTKAAPFAKLTLDTIQTANMMDATQQKVPYRGISFVGIPEFQSIGTAVGQEVAAVIAGQKSVDEALKASQALTQRAVDEAGYPK